MLVFLGFQKLTVVWGLKLRFASSRMVEKIPPWVDTLSLHQAPG